MSTAVKGRRGNVKKRKQGVALHLHAQTKVSARGKIRGGWQNQTLCLLTCGAQLNGDAARAHLGVLTLSPGRQRPSCPSGGVNRREWQGLKGSKKISKANPMLSKRGRENLGGDTTLGIKDA